MLIRATPSELAPSPGHPGNQVPPAVGRAVSKQSSIPWQPLSTLRLNLNLHAIHTCVPHGRRNSVPPFLWPRGKTSGARQRTYFLTSASACSCGRTELPLFPMPRETPLAPFLRPRGRTPKRQDVNISRTSPFASKPACFPALLHPSLLAS